MWRDASLMITWRGLHSLGADLWIVGHADSWVVGHERPFSGITMPWGSWSYFKNCPVLTKCSSLLADGCVTLFGSCCMSNAMKEITQDVFKNVTITYHFLQIDCKETISNLPCTSFIRIWFLSVKLLPSLLPSLCTLLVRKSSKQPPT